MFEIYTWNCPEDTSLFRKIVEQKRTFKFLLGLNKTLDEVRGRIMGTKPLPNLREAFSEVRREESRKKVMMGTHNSGSSLEGSALISRTASWDSRQKKGRPWCEHCHKPGHTKETCWKIHGKPSDWKPSRPSNDKEGRAYTAANSDPFTKEQLEVLQKLFNQNITPTSASSLTVQKNTTPTGNNNCSEPWVVDSGASDHMTGDDTILHEYSQCKEDSTIKIADGTLSKIEGKGQSRISKDMHLKSVLYVPKLDCNLLSISKLTRDLNCVVKFFPNFCVFQDLVSGKRIGSARMYAGL